MQCTHGQTILPKIKAILAEEKPSGKQRSTMTVAKTMCHYFVQCGSGSAPYGENHLSGCDANLKSAWDIGEGLSLCEVVQEVQEINAQRRQRAPGHAFSSASSNDLKLRADPASWPRHSADPDRGI